MKAYLPSNRSALPSKLIRIMLFMVVLISEVYMRSEIDADACSVVHTASRKHPTDDNRVEHMLVFFRQLVTWIALPSTNPQDAKLLALTLELLRSVVTLDPIVVLVSSFLKVALP